MRAHHSCRQMGLKKEEMGDEEQVDHGHRKKKASINF
jgi:hypothetical protein